MAVGWDVCIRENGICWVGKWIEEICVGKGIVGWINGLRRYVR